MCRQGVRAAYDRVQAAAHVCGRLEQVLHHPADLAAARGALVLGEEEGEVSACERPFPARAFAGAICLVVPLRPRGLFLAIAFRRLRLPARVGPPQRDAGHGLVDRLAQKRGAVGVVEQGELRVEPQVQGMLVQDARAHPVDGADPGGVNGKRLLHEPLGAQRRAHARLDLAGGEVGERDGEYLVDAVYARLLGVEQGVGDALGEHERLARAGASRDEQRPVDAGDAGALVVGKRGEIHLAHLPRAVGHAAALAGELPEARVRFDVSVEEPPDRLGGTALHVVDQGVQAARAVWQGPDKTALVK